MPNLVRNLLAILAGVVLGGAVNMALVMAGPSLIPPPPGVDVTDPESLKSGIHLFQPRHFLMPFLAHALGTLAGAITAYLVAASHRERFAWGIGGFFLLGGVAASFMIPAPGWFIAVDLLVAYLPMAWLGTRIASRWAAPPPPA